MKLACITRHGVDSLALEHDSVWYALDILCRDASSQYSSVPRLLEVDPNLDWILMRLLESARERGQLTSAAIAEPEHVAIPLRPGKIVALGRNYAAHARELGNDIPTEPLFFAKAPSACIANGQAIILKDWYGRVDYEGELAVLIGKNAKNIEAKHAYEYIAGYTLLNDVTARDMQSADKHHGHPWFRCKNLDTFCPVGPAIATRGSLPWPLEVDISVKINGELRQQANTRQFIFAIPEMLAYLTRFMTLEPGDLVSTGTPEGVGPLNPGDFIEIHVPEVGTLRNGVQFVTESNGYAKSSVQATR